MSSAFSNIGHDVTLLTSSYNMMENDSIDAFDYYGVKKNFTIKRVFCPQIRFGWILHGFNCYRYIRKMRPDLIYSREPFGAYLSGMNWFKTIFECHSPPIGRRDKFLFPKLFSIRNIIKVVVISEALKRILLESIPFIDEKRIIVAHDGVDLDKFKFPVKNDEAKKTLGLDGNDFVIGYAGSLYKGRGIELILELAKEFKQDKFIIMGGQNNDIKDAKKLAEKKDIKNILLLGYIPNSKLLNYLSTCDILLMPYQKQLYSASGKKRGSSQWMSPMKMFEYMASGIPIISSDISVLKEVLENEVNSLLVKPDSVLEWVNAINRVKNENSLGRKLARNARSKAKSYSWTKRAKNVLS